MSSPNAIHGAENDGPWVFAFDDFVSEQSEIDHLLEGGASHGRGFERSTDQGRSVGGSGEMVKLTSSTRTSSNAWCRASCEELPGVRSVTERIEEVSAVGQPLYSVHGSTYLAGQLYRNLSKKGGNTLSIQKRRPHPLPPNARRSPRLSPPSVFSLLPVGIPETTGDGHTAEPLRILPDSTIRGGTGE